MCRWDWRLRDLMLRARAWSVVNSRARDCQYQSISRPDSEGTHIMRYSRNIMLPALLIPQWVIRMALLNKIIKQPEILHAEAIRRVDLARDDNGPGVVRGARPLAVTPRLLDLDLGPLASQAALRALRAVGVVLGALRRWGQ